MSPLIRKERIWPTIIISVLVLDVAVGFAMMRLASDDPHAAIESDYYRKAVTWDSTMAQVGRNAALGWTIQPSLGAITPRREAPLTLHLRDRSGAPVTDATILIEAVQVAHAGEIVHGTLTGAGDSGYATSLPMTRPGLWELRVIATRGSDRFTADLRLNASTTGDAVVVTERPGDAPATPAPAHPAGS
jgi:nitrogen fixation protein FixH